MQLLEHLVILVIHPLLLSLPCLYQEYLAVQHFLPFDAASEVGKIEAILCGLDVHQLLFNGSLVYFFRAVELSFDLGDLLLHLVRRLFLPGIFFVMILQLLLQVKEHLLFAFVLSQKFVNFTSHLPLTDGRVTRVGYTRHE